MDFHIKGKNPFLINSCLSSEGKGIKFFKSNFHTSTYNKEGTSYNNKNLEPWLVTGLIDGEGSISIRLVKRSGRRFGFELKPGFFINMHLRDTDLLLKVRDFLNCGVGVE